jgi:transposase
MLLQMEQENCIDLYFGDQSGFSLEPCVPYGWQPKSEYTAILSQKSKRRNVFGLLRKNNEFKYYEKDGSMDSDFIINSLDDFSTCITRRSVVCLDNAPIHRSKKFKNMINEWQQKDLWIWFFPAYSPHLNIIETLWRKIKYEWLTPKDYLNAKTLDAALDNILDKIGRQYVINFT